MDLLVIGGSRFVGRHIVSAALARGHRVTVFNRGQTNAEPIPGTESVSGDRETDLHLLEGRTWDAVLDTCGYVPRIVKLSVDALKGRVGRYTFVSTISVYPPDLQPGGDEDSPLLEPPSLDVEVVNGDTYGGLKVACERAVEEAFGEHATFVRPGIVVGPHDHTDRFSWWARRFARPGPFLVPDKPRSAIQYVDGRDLAAFTLDLTEEGTNGAFNACGPFPPIDLATFVQRGVRCFDGVSEPIWAPQEALQKAGVEPWSGVPLVSSFEEGIDGLFSLDVTKSVRAGFVQRSLESTLRDTVAWLEADRRGEEMRAGIGDKEEAEFLGQLKLEAPRP